MFFYVRTWSQEFTYGTTICEHTKGTGRPQTGWTEENVDRTCDLIIWGRWLTPECLVERTGSSNNTIEIKEWLFEPS